MPASAKAALTDILDAIRRIEQYVAEVDPALINLPRMNYDAVLFSVLLVSEATRQLPDELKARRPDLPWRDIATTGNNIRHRYFKIDRKVIAEIVRRDLPALRHAIVGFWNELDLGPLLAST